VDGRPDRRVTLANANVGVRERITETAIFLSTERP
jgi:hypothetical protein